MVILNILSLLLGGYLTYKIITNQDFEHERVLFRWVNYLFACVGGLCVTIPLFNIITEGGVVGLTTSLAMFFIAIISLFSYWKCSFSAREAYFKLKRLHNSHKFE